MEALCTAEPPVKALFFLFLPPFFPFGAGFSNVKCRYGRWTELQGEVLSGRFVSDLHSLPSLFVHGSLRINFSDRPFLATFSATGTNCIDPKGSGIVERKEGKKKSFFPFHLPSNKMAKCAGRERRNEKGEKNPYRHINIIPRDGKS